MIFRSLFTALLIATAAFAAPEGAIAHQSRRSARRQSKPLRRLSKNTSLTAATNTNNVVYSPNWAGAVWNSYPPNTFDKVTGTFTVPTPSLPNGDASVWVGIDGDTCREPAILQTGINMSYQNGTISYESWYEWYPDYAYSFDSPIDIRADDIIRLTITASSATSGTALVENLTTGKSESQFLSYPSHPLCKQNAEWIVEDFTSGDGSDPSLEPFCNFGTVTFSNASAHLHNGHVISPYGAAEIFIEQNGKVLTSVSSTSETVTIKYV